MRSALVIGIIGLLAGGASAAQSIANSKHNLSASGPGAVRAGGEQEICIFCHTPHGAGHNRALWNRTLSNAAYTVYSSNTLQAKPKQPTGSSKLCLSCHDGTIAVGSVLSRGQVIQMADGTTTLQPGKGSLGTDLSDDHPISFAYDSGLAAKNLKLQDPSSLAAVFRMGKNKSMQCHTCHDAHDNTNGNFLVMDNSASQMCNSCHKMGNSDVAGHAQCITCHKMHSAPSGPYLLQAKKISDTCNTCHGGQNLQAGNIKADIQKLSKHDTASDVNLPKPIPDTADCASCHEPHTITKLATSAPNIPGRFGAMAGIDAAGAPITAAKYEYEVCFRCHADQLAKAPISISRQIVNLNKRLQFSTSAVSFHPVEATGRNMVVPSLRPGYTTASIIYCNDCHNSDTGKKAGSTGPDGTHGSNQRWVLIANYVTTDRTAETADAYALCYRCHDRNNILANKSFSLHSLHIVDKQTPCSVCHDAHGIPSTQGTVQGNSNLINFDKAVVLPNSLGQLSYSTTGPGAASGTCNLTCHSKDHNNISYGPGGVVIVGQTFGIPTQTTTPPPPTPNKALVPGPGLPPTGVGPSVPAPPQPPPQPKPGPRRGK